MEIDRGQETSLIPDINNSDGLLSSYSIYQPSHKQIRPLLDILSVNLGQ